ncbi:MAG: YitT family protein [Oscillospiraceae bacterium]|jgi:uncharacterized membrane-anchored protein YitT (DUF2179 family)|nr:YitT family protein [Oscillospiraceae bacterium]
MKIPKIQIKKPTWATVRTLLADQLYYLVGCVSYAAAVNLFALPNRIAQSGVSGVAIIANYLLHTPIGMTNLALNIPLIALAWAFLGWRFVSKTLWVTVELSVILDLMAHFLPASVFHTEDRLLATLFCGALAGFGLAVIMARGASSGGTDIVGWLVRRRWPHISLGRVILVADAIVVVGSAAVFRDLNSAMYAAIVMFISSRLIDAILYGMGNGKMFYIFCEHPEALAKAIITQLGRGVTILPAKGAYTGQAKEMLLCVVRRGEATRLRRLVKAHDPKSFLVITEAQEILGYGFQELGGGE